MKRLTIILLVALSLQGCVVIRSFTGANVDHERYALAREAASLEVRYKAALQLADRLSRGNDPMSGDMVLQLEEDLILRLLQKLRGRQGWLDRETRYVIDSLQGDLHPGSAFVTMHLNVHNEGYGVDVRILMDCQLALIPEGDALRVEFEPFNVVPDVSAGGVLSIAEDLIEDVIRVKLGTLREQFPPFKLPLGFDESIAIDGTVSEVRGTPNLVISAARRLIDYRLKVKDVLVFDQHVLLTADLESIRVK
jgi:hypothetical protein